MGAGFVPKADVAEGKKLELVLRLLAANQSPGTEAGRVDFIAHQHTLVPGGDEFVVAAHGDLATEEELLGGLEVAVGELAFTLSDHE